MRYPHLRKLPVVSGNDVIKLLNKFGYSVIRQKGSHVRLQKEFEGGVHNITIPLHKELAKGTLNDILSKIAIWNNISREELIESLKKI